MGYDIEINARPLWLAGASDGEEIIPNVRLRSFLPSSSDILTEQSSKRSCVPASLSESSWIPKSFGVRGGVNQLLEEVPD